MKISKDTQIASNFRISLPPLKSSSILIHTLQSQLPLFGESHVSSLLFHVLSCVIVSFRVSQDARISQRQFSSLRGTARAASRALKSPLAHVSDLLGCFSPSFHATELTFTPFPPLTDRPARPPTQLIKNGKAHQEGRHHGQVRNQIWWYPS